MLSQSSIWVLRIIVDGQKLFIQMLFSGMVEKDLGIKDKMTNS